MILNFESAARAQDVTATRNSLERLDGLLHARNKTPGVVRLDVDFMSNLVEISPPWLGPCQDLACRTRLGDSFWVLASIIELNPDGSHSLHVRFKSNSSETG